MRVFVAGATGAIGHPLVSALIAAGHEPIGMTSSEHGLRTLRDYGVEGVLADALDAQAVDAALRKVRPAAVIDELTSLPRHYTPDAMRAAAERDRRVRLEGGGNVLNAALAAGTRRYVAQSTGFFYGPGEGLAVETDTLAADATPAIAASVRTYQQIEKRLLRASDLNAVALRYGFFTDRAPGSRKTATAQTRLANASIRWRAPEAASGPGSRSRTLRRLRRRRSNANRASTTSWTMIHPKLQSGSPRSPMPSERRSRHD